VRFQSEIPLSIRAGVFVSVYISRFKLSNVLKWVYLSAVSILIMSFIPIILYGFSRQAHLVVLVYNTVNIIGSLVGYRLSEYIVSSNRAIALVQQKTKELEESHQRFKSLFKQNSAAIYSLDTEGIFTNINKACENLTGYTAKELLGSSIANIIDEEVGRKSLYYFNNILKGIPQNYETTFITKEGLKLELDVNYIPIIIDGKTIGIYSIIKDITENKKNQRIIHHMAYHDILTGLPNRRFFQDKIEGFILNKESKTAAVMYIDLDGFKVINDSWGHQIGDQVLTTVAERLKSCLRKGDVVSRQGGDEFAIFVTDISSEEDIEKVARKILGSIDEPFLINGCKFIIGCSIGIALYPDHGNNSTVLQKNADTAMYCVKETGKNGYVFFNPSLNQPTNLHRVIEEQESSDGHEY